MSGLTTGLPEQFHEQGVQLPLLICGWVALGLIVLAALCLAGEMLPGLDDLGLIGGLFSGIFGAILAVIWVLMLVPFDGKYQHYYRVEGHVTSVSNVLSDANGDLTRQPVLTIEGIERPLVVDDPRAIQLEDRDVVLRCTVGWHYNAADTYECAIVDFGVPA